jgi:general transcription factor 3C polypeptide 5 (transcription factor C subunit 1)
MEFSNSHIFDGKTLTKETAAYQLCDIEDPLLKSILAEASKHLREECSVCYRLMDRHRRLMLLLT